MVETTEQPVITGDGGSYSGGVHYYPVRGPPGLRGYMGPPGPPGKRRFTS